MLPLPGFWPPRRFLLSSRPNVISAPRVMIAASALLVLFLPASIPIVLVRILLPPGTVQPGFVSWPLFAALLLFRHLLLCLRIFPLCRFLPLLLLCLLPPLLCLPLRILSRTYFAFFPPLGFPRSCLFWPIFSACSSLLLICSPASPPCFLSLLVRALRRLLPLKCVFLLPLIYAFTF